MLVLVLGYALASKSAVQLNYYKSLFVFSISFFFPKNSGGVDATQDPLASYSGVWKCITGQAVFCILRNKCTYRNSNVVSPTLLGRPYFPLAYKIHLEDLRPSSWLLMNYATQDPLLATALFGNVLLDRRYSVFWETNALTGTVML